MITRSATTAAIMADMPAAGLLLTGGASRRMGQDKAALPATDGGESLAGRTARLLAAATSPTLEVGPGWSDLPAVVEVQRGGGPLVALAAGRRELCGPRVGRPGRGASPPTCPG